MAVRIHTGSVTKLILLFILLIILLTSCSKSESAPDAENNITTDPLNKEKNNQNSDGNDYNKYMLAPDEETDNRKDTQRIEISEGKVALAEIDRKRFVLSFIESINEKSVKMAINYLPEILKLNKAAEVDGYEFILRKLDRDVSTIFTGRDKVKFYLITKEGLFTEVLEENQYKRLKRGDSEYEVEATYISKFYAKPSVRLKIDGEETDYLEEDENQNLKNSNMVYIGEIHLAETKEPVTRDIIEIGIRKAEKSGEEENTE